MKYIRYFLIGMLLGVANVIPGVSSGTMAVVTNTYDHLINTLSMDFKYIKKYFWDILFLFVGIIGGILCFSFIITYLLEHYFMATMLFFLGLVVGGLPYIFHNAKQQPPAKQEWTKWLALVIGIVAIVMLTFVNAEDNTVAVTSVSFSQGMLLMMFTAIASIGMVMPGVSGSLIMMVFGIYNTVFSSIKSFNFAILPYVLIGLAFGIILGAIVIKKLLKKYPQFTYYLIIGLVIGSIYAIIPPISWSIQLIYGIICLATGLVAGYYITKLSMKTI